MKVSADVARGVDDAAERERDVDRSALGGVDHRLGEGVLGAARGNHAVASGGDADLDARPCGACSAGAASWPVAASNSWIFAGTAPPSSVTTTRRRDGCETTKRAFATAPAVIVTFASADAARPSPSKRAVYAPGGSSAAISPPTART